MSDNLSDVGTHRTPNLSYSGDGVRKIEMPSLSEYQQTKPQLQPHQAHQEQPPQNLWETQTDNNEVSALPPVPDSVPEEVYQAMTGPDLEEPNNNQDDTEVEPIPTNQQVSKPVKKSTENPASIRIRELKEANRRSEREKEEMAKQLQQFQFQQMQMQQMMQQNPQQQVAEEPEDADILKLDGDSLAEVKDLQKMYQEMRAMKKELNMHKARTAQEQMRSHQELTQTKLLANYPDFYSVCSKENLAVLEAMQPELAETILSNKNAYSQMVTAYTMVKQFGIDKEYLIENDRMRALKNSNKPRPMNSIRPQQGESPLQKANAYAQGEMTPQMQEMLRREMYESRKNH